MNNPTLRPIRIGVLTILVGAFKVLGEDALRGVQIALDEHGGKAGGRPITLKVAGTNAIPDTAFEEAKRLIEDEEVDFIVGPMSGNEGLAVTDYAKSRLDHVFLNGTAGTQDMT